MRNITRATALQLGLMTLAGCSLAGQDGLSEQSPADENVDRGGASPELPQLRVLGSLENITTRYDEQYLELDYTDGYGVSTHYYVKFKLKRGSSVAYWKRNYNITFYTDASYTNKLKVDFGFGAAKKFTLMGNHIDGSHARNIVSARIAAKLHARHGLFEGTLNHGVIDGIALKVESDDLKGIYTLTFAKTDKLWGVDDKKPGQLGIQAKGWTEATAFNGEIDAFTGSSGELPVGSGWEQEAGAEPDEQTIVNFNALVRFIKDSDDETFKRELHSRLNLDATIDYLLMLHVMNGIDNTNKNMVLVTLDDGRFWTPTLYDMDCTWGNYWTGELTDYDFLPEYTSDSDDIHPVMISNLWRRVLENFGPEVAEAWFELREEGGLFSQESIEAEFQKFFDSVGEENYAFDAEQWPTQSRYFMDQIVEFLDFRLPFVDEYMQELSTRNASA